MTIIKHELRQSLLSFLIWCFSIAILMVICICLFPEFKGQMDSVGEMFASMGVFSEAFGMDRMNFGTLTGFYAIECGNILGLGGAFFASLTAISILAKEEKDGTSEFLLTHPISRKQVLSEKLIALLLQIVLLNIIIFILSIVAIVIINEAIPWNELILLHLAYLIMHLELACICFGISAFIKKGLGVGIGMAVMMYFINLIANMSDSMKWLKYFTPFGYCEAADIVTNNELDIILIIIGIIVAIVGVGIGYIKYCRKDIH